MIQLNARKIAIRQVSQLCLPVQLDYLSHKKCCGIKPIESRIRGLDQELANQWSPGGRNYFDPTWLDTKMHFKQIRSAPIKLQSKNPTQAFYTAIDNIELQKPGASVQNLEQKSAFRGVVIVSNGDKYNPISHAIAIRKSHSGHYFIHDLYQNSTEKSSVDACTCKEQKYFSHADFKVGLATLLKAYIDNQFSDLFIIELQSTRRSMLSQINSKLKWVIPRLP